MPSFSPGMQSPKVLHFSKGLDLQIAPFGVRHGYPVAKLQSPTQLFTRLAEGDDTVMEQERTGQKWMPFIIVALYHHLAEFRHLFLIYRFASVDDVLSADTFQNERRCLAGHNSRAASHICKAKHRLETPSAHAVVCRPVVGSNYVLDFRNIQHAASTHHVRSVFSYTVPFFLFAYHIARRSLEKDHRQLRVTASNHPFRRLSCRFDINDAVAIGCNDSHGHAFQPHLAGNDRFAPGEAVCGLVFMEIAIVGNTLEGILDVDYAVCIDRR